MQRFVRGLSAALIVTSSLVMPRVSCASADDFSPPRLRLPADVVSPVRYRVNLSVVPDQDAFTGTIEIDLRVTKATSILWLNGEKLAVKEATLSAKSEKLSAKVITAPKDFVGFVFEHPIGPGEATLRVAYQGQINRKDQQGIFQVKNGDHWYVYTQFESIWARQAFPCFDEPGYKVPWQLTLHVKRNQVALSNTPIISETLTDDGVKAVKFAETRPLPSYLVALSVGEFDFVDAGTAGKNKTRIRIAVPRGRGAEAKYASETTPAIVNLLEDYFGIPYPYDKLDEVAVPLFGGAMENAGQVTYGVSLILAKADQDTIQRQREWVWVAAHELAHQWFGDLVTTAWWDDIWLNEGFASWMANKIANDYHPEWQMHVGYVNTTQEAMVNDSLVSARRVRQPIESNDDIFNAFDQITYDKGSALLNMFESYMGPNNFREGVRRYLAKYAWQNATSADFLAALAGNDVTIALAFSSFLDQPGVPLVKVSLICNRKAASIELSQERFLPLGSTGSASQLWKVPVCMRYSGASGDRRECLLLDRPKASIALSKGTSCPGWVEANADGDGYYRALYEGDLLADLLKDDAGLSQREKVALIGDISALTGNGKIPLGTALALAPSLARDSARRVVTKTLEITTDPNQNLVPASLMPKYRLYLEDLYGRRARQLGWKAKSSESDDDRLLRLSLLDVVANQAESPDLVAQANNLAVSWLEDRNTVDPDMVGTVLSTAARHGDRALFDRLRAVARQEKDEQIQRDLLRAMGLFSQPEIAKTAFSIVLTDEFDVRQSIRILLRAGGSPNTRELAYDFVKQNWDALVTRLPTDWVALMPSFLLGGFCDEQHRHDAANFFEGRSTKYVGGPRELAQTLEQIDLCVAYKKAQQPSLAKFFERYGTTN